MAVTKDQAMEEAVFEAEDDEDQFHLYLSPDDEGPDEVVEEQGGQGGTRPPEISSLPRVTCDPGAMEDTLMLGYEIRLPLCQGEAFIDSRPFDDAADPFKGSSSDVKKASVRDPSELAFPFKHQKAFWGGMVNGFRQRSEEDPASQHKSATKRLQTRSYIDCDEDVAGGDDIYAGLNERRRALTLGLKASATGSSGGRMARSSDAPEALSAAVGDDLEELMSPRLGRKAAARLRKAEREATRGDGWFGMGAPEMTEELQRDLEVIQMRSAVDPKRFYKKNDHRKNGMPRYFQVAQVVDDRTNVASSGSGVKANKKSLVDELMADAEFQKYNKRKYSEIIKQQQKASGGSSKYRNKKK